MHLILKEENNKLIINKWYWSKLFQYHLYCNYLLRPNPIAFSIFFNVLNEALCALSLPLSKMLSNSSEL